MNRFSKKITILLITILIACNITACDNHDLESYRPIEDVNNLEGRKVGVLIGWAEDYLLSSRDDMNLYRYDSLSDMLTALCFKQLDAAALEFINAKFLISQSTGLGLVEEPAFFNNYIVLFNKDGEELKNDFNDWLEDYMETEEYAEWYDRIQNFDGNNYIYHEIEVPADGKPVRLISYDSYYPIAYKETDGTAKGFDIELARAFFRDRGYTPQITQGSGTVVFTELSLGRQDMFIGDEAEAYMTDIVAGGYKYSNPYKCQPSYFVEIKDPDNLSIGGDVYDR